MGVVKEKQVEAALAFMDGDHAAEIFFRARMAKEAYDEAEDEAYLSFNDGAVEERKRRARQVPRVRELAREYILAETEQIRLKHKWEKADAIVRLYQTESANSRKGNF